MIQKSSRFRFVRNPAAGNLWACLWAAVLFVASSFWQGLNAKPQDHELQPSAVEQIAALLQEKMSRNPVQQKLDSRIIYELKRIQGSALLQQVPQLRGLQLNGEDMIEVDISGRVTADLLDRIQAEGGLVVNAHPRFEAIRAKLPLNRIEAVALEPDLRFVAPADQFMLLSANRTEGDVAHRADTARLDFGVDGTGIKVAAISDSVDALPNLLGCDLPSQVTVLPGQSGNPGTSEGTALLEIIFDMAPGAELFFATAVGGQAQFAQNILDLEAAGCKVIVDDALYFSEGAFQDDIVSQAVEEVAAKGVAYLTSAGNSGNFNHGTAGVWEGNYSGVPLPAPLAGAGLSAHDFGGGDTGNTITMDSPFFFTLQWNDPLNGSTNDYDLFLLDPTLSTVLGASTGTQNGTQDPFEIINTTASNDLNNRLVVVLFNGTDRFINVNTHRGQLEEATNGQIFGHPGALGALTIAAVNVATAFGGPFVGGAANPVEVFSSDGPRRIFFNADGTPVGEADGLLGPVSVIRTKPDVTAADGVTTATPGFNPFFGTSASAPHAAGISALFSELFPNIPNSDMFDIFRSSALDIEIPGFDFDSGSGIIDAADSLGTPIFSDGFESGNTSAWTN